MPQPFLLRFQEPCSSASSVDLASGTATKTSVGREQADSDKPFASGPEASTGTKTITEVENEREQRDTDRTGYAGTIPRLSRTQVARGTMTSTGVETEQTDSDASQQRSHSLPR